MSIAVARRKRIWLYLSISGLLATAAAVSAISARDPDGVGLRLGMILMTVGAALWLNWQALLPLTLLIWLGPNAVRASITDDAGFSTNMLLELPGLLGLAATATLVRLNLRQLEDEDVLIGAASEDRGIDRSTGVHEERLLRPALEVELLRARRFNRRFAFVLVSVDEINQRFDYRSEEEWSAAFKATAELLRGTRVGIDRVYRYADDSFALLLPESGEEEVRGLVRRLTRVAKSVTPAVSEQGGPLPVHFGATFFPDCATSVDTLIQRAGIALRLADKSPTRLQLDGAEAPEPPPPETLRRPPQAEGVATASEPAGSGALPELEAQPVALSTSEAAAAKPDAAEAAEALARAPLAAVAAEGKGGAIAPAAKRAAVDGAFSDLVKHLDETLELLRSLKQPVAAGESGESKPGPWSSRPAA